MQVKIWLFTQASTNSLLYNINFMDYAAHGGQKDLLYLYDYFL